MSIPVIFGIERLRLIVLIFTFSSNICSNSSSRGGSSSSSSSSGRGSVRGSSSGGSSSSSGGDGSISSSSRSSSTNSNMSHTKALVLIHTSVRRVVETSELQSYHECPFVGLK